MGADKVDGFLPSVLTKCDVNHTGGLSSQHIERDD